MDCKSNLGRHMIDNIYNLLKGVLTVEQDGCTEIKYFLLKAKSNQSLGGDDYFFALAISFPSIYPAPPQSVMRAIKAS